jgi:hypothetical protein
MAGWLAPMCSTEPAESADGQAETYAQCDPAPEGVDFVISIEETIENPSCISISALLQAPVSTASKWH